MACLVHFRKKLSLFMIIFCSLFICCVLFYISEKREKPIIAYKLVNRQKTTQPVTKILASRGSEDKARHRQQTLQNADGNNQTSIFDSSDTEKMELSDIIQPQPVKGFQLAKQNGLIEFLETASCTPIPASLVLYNRIFKTGSETMGAQFRAAANMTNYKYTRRTTEDFYDQGISKPYPELIEKEANNSPQQMFFNAHFYFRNNLKLQRTHTYINQVREPLARYISHYTYMYNTRHRPLERVQKMIESGEINETIEQCFDKQGQGCKHNVMTRFFCGPETFCKNDQEKALKRAKENIMKYYAVVGLLEHFHLTLKIIQKRLPCFLPLIPRDPTRRENRAVKTNARTVSEEMIAKIKKTNWADIELYEFVKKLFWRQVKACGICETESDELDSPCMSPGSRG